jgi:hypothetical protein
MVFFKGPFEGKSVYKIGAPGKPKIDIILDGRTIYAYIQPIATFHEHHTVIMDTMTPTLLMECCTGSGEEIVKEDVTATLDDTGILTIEIPLQASV